MRNGGGGLPQPPSLRSVAPAHTRSDGPASGPSPWLPPVIGTEVCCVLVTRLRRNRRPQCNRLCWHSQGVAAVRLSSARLVLIAVSTGNVGWHRQPPSPAAPRSARQRSRTAAVPAASGRRSRGRVVRVHAVRSGKQTVGPPGSGRWPPGRQLSASSLAVATRRVQVPAHRQGRRFDCGTPYGGRTATAARAAPAVLANENGPFGYGHRVVRPAVVTSSRV